jgi:hypothetical protein
LLDYICSFPILQSFVVQYFVKLEDDAGSWCRGLTCLPVTEEIAGSNPVGPATDATKHLRKGGFLLHAGVLKPIEPQRRIQNIAHVY